MKFKLIVCVVLLMLGVLPVMAQDSSLAGSWVLVSINGQAVLESAPITAEFSAEGIKGSAGCNAYFGTFTFDNTALKMSPLASTRKSCDGAGVMEQEAAFLTALQTAATYQAGGGQLVVNYDGGALTFAADLSAVTPTPIPDTGDSSLGGLAGSWVLVSYGAAQPVLAEAPITAVFAREGVSGSAGCNSYNANFSYNNGTLTVNGMAATEKACETAGVMEQEAAFLTALAGAINYQLGGAQLLINYDGGVLTFAVDPTAVVATVIPDTSDTVLGGLAGSWTLATLNGQAVLETAPITAEFSAEGIKGSAGCNSYFGTFGYANSTLSMSPLASTLVACEDTAVMEQEAAYLAALQTAAAYQVSDGQLVVNYDGGILTFTKDPEPTVIPDTADSSLGGLAGSWTLVSYGGGQQVLPGYPITADFTAQGVSGSAGCNTYSGIFIYNDGTVEISDLISTQLACVDASANEQEAAYLAALQTTGSYQVSAEQLIIGYEGGALTFVPAG